MTLQIFSDRICEAANTRPDQTQLHNTVKMNIFIMLIRVFIINEQQRILIGFCFCDIVAADTNTDDNDNRRN